MLIYLTSRCVSLLGNYKICVLCLVYSTMYIVNLYTITSCCKFRTVLFVTHLLHLNYHNYLSVGLLELAYYSCSSV